MSAAKQWRCWRAGPQDEAALVELERTAFGARSWGAASVASCLDEPHVRVVFAAKDALANHSQPETNIDGFAIWRVVADEAEILTIGVTPEQQRQGGGAFMLEHICDDARKAGASVLFLEVDAGNSAAIALYDARGFRQIGRRDKYYKNGADALIMGLTLAPLTWL